MHPESILFRNINMELKQSKNNICEIEPPKGLKQAVLGRIKLEQEKKVFRKKILYFCGFFACISAFLFSGIYFGHEILTSDFWSIGSLAFTDLKIVSAYWQEFSLSLLETFPFEAVAFVLAPVFMLLVLTKKYYEQQNLFKLKFN
jgi:hypothetical protein